MESYKFTKVILLLTEGFALFVLIFYVYCIYILDYTYFDNWKSRNSGIWVQMMKKIALNFSSTPNITSSFLPRTKIHSRNCLTITTHPFIPEKKERCLIDNHNEFRLINGRRIKAIWKNILRTILIAKSRERNFFWFLTL